MFFNITLDEYVHSVGGHRHYRGRNKVSGSSSNWDADFQEIDADAPYWDDMISHSVRLGIQAARKTFKPALIVWGLMALIAFLFYTVPASHYVFHGLVAFQDLLGPFFPTVGTGLAVGVLVETTKVICSESKRWSRENSVNAIFNFLLFGIMGLTTYYRYPLQDEWFGSGNSIAELTSKVAFDQFVWTVFIANPYQCLGFIWKNNGFSMKAVKKQIFPVRTFWGTQMLPVLVANWAFWIPMAYIVYSFPSELQLPLSILAITIWVMLLTVLSATTNSNEN